MDTVAHFERGAACGILWALRTFLRFKVMTTSIDDMVLLILESCVKGLRVVPRSIMVLFVLAHGLEAKCNLWHYLQYSTDYYLHD